MKTTKQIIDNQFQIITNDKVGFYWNENNNPKWYSVSDVDEIVNDVSSNAQLWHKQQLEQLQKELKRIPKIIPNDYEDYCQYIDSVFNNFKSLQSKPNTHHSNAMTVRVSSLDGVGLSPRISNHNSYSKSRQDTFNNFKGK